MKTLRKIKGLGLLVTTIMSLSLSANVKKTDCLYKGNTVCKSIIKLNPSMDHKSAYKLSNIFYSIAKKHRVDPMLMISIAFQESTFKLSTVRSVSGLVYDEEQDVYKESKVGSDFCMMQINSRNIQKMKLEVNKLLTDNAYCIEAGAKILAGYKKMYKKEYEQDWWTFYNARTEAKRDIYFRHVSRHLSKLSPPIVTIVEERSIASSK